MQADECLIDIPGDDMCIAAAGPCMRVIVWCGDALPGIYDADFGSILLEPLYPCAFKSQVAHLDEEFALARLHHLLGSRFISLRTAVAGNKCGDLISVACYLFSEIAQWFYGHCNPWFLTACCRTGGSARDTAEGARCITRERETCDSPDENHISHRLADGHTDK